MTGARTFDEGFDSAVLVFTDGTYQELKGLGSAVPAGPGVDEILTDFHRHMRHRTENPRSYLEYTLGDEQIPNVEAELLAELYNPNSPPSFSAYLRGRHYRDLRFLIAPRGAMRHMPSPEEVGLIHLDPTGRARRNPLSHAPPQRMAKLIPPVPMRTSASSRLRATASKPPSPATAASPPTPMSTFQALRDGDRVLDFGLLPSLARLACLNGRRQRNRLHPGRPQRGRLLLCATPSAQRERTTLQAAYRVRRQQNPRRRREWKFFRPRPHQLVSERRMPSPTAPRSI